jgi:ribosome-binding factor A
MANIRRRERLASVIEEIVAELLQRQIKDPRVAGLTSVTRVEVTQDLHLARIWVSVPGDEAERQETMRGLERARGFVRSKLGEELSIRHIPEVQFMLDRSIEQGDRVLALLNQLEIPPKAAESAEPPEPAGPADGE